MRFDDRLATILAMPAGSTGSRAVVWSQFADLLAQEGGGLDPATREDIVARMASLRHAVPLDRRAAVARALAAPGMDPELARHLLDDEAQVASPVLTALAGEARALEALVPHMSRPARALLREREQVPLSVRRMLDAYSHADRALPLATGAAADEAGDWAGDLAENSDGEGEAEALAPAPQPEPPAPPAQLETGVAIGELVRRIDAYQRSREAQADLFGLNDLPVRKAQSFRFETGPDGVIAFVEGAEPGALAGISLAEMAEPGGAGVDGTIAGAYRHRSDIERGRLTVAGDSDAAGNWTIFARALFDKASGRFLGYRGVGARPGARPMGADALSPLGAGLSSDSLRQLVHELRTPLNAIRGFAEMISGQIVGPVGHAYRERAAAIAEDVERLTVLFDGIDSAARLDRDEFPAEATDTTDIAAMLTGQGVSLPPNCRLGGGDAAPLVAAIPPGMAARIVVPLAWALSEAGNAHEPLQLSATRSKDEIQVRLALPSGLAWGGQGIEEALARHDEQRPDTLGLGFSLRLASRLVARAGGRLSLGRTRIDLILPAATGSPADLTETG